MVDYILIICGEYMLDYVSLSPTNHFFVGSKSMFPNLALLLGGVSTKGEQVHSSATLLFFLFRQKGGESYLNLVT